MLTLARNEFKIPEIIYDPTLVLSPHVFLLGMLFKACAFKSPSIDCPERLYSLTVLKGLNEQPLPLRDEMNNEFIFCEAVREAQGVRIARELQLSSGSVRYRMKVGGEITGFGQVLKPYNLRDGSAKGLNESRRCLDLPELRPSIDLRSSKQRMLAIRFRIKSCSMQVSALS